MEVMTTATTCRKTMREMIDLKRSTLLFLGDQVAHTAYGVNLDLGTTLRELLAKTVHVDLDRVRSDFAGMPEDVVLDLLLGDDAPLAPHQQFEHGGFARRKHLRLIVDRGLPVARIEFEVGDAQRIAEQMARPAQLRFQPRDQFLQRERLDEIVVGAATQALNAVIEAAAGGQDQHWDGVVAVANLAQQLEPIAVG